MKIMLMISGLFLAAAAANASTTQLIECKVANGSITIAKDPATSKVTWSEAATGETPKAPKNVTCADFTPGPISDDESTTNLLKMMNVDPKKVVGTVSVDCLYGEIAHKLMQFNDKDEKRLGAALFTTNMLVMPVICL